MRIKNSASVLFNLIGALGAAFSKWFLIWLFARSTDSSDAVGQYSLVLAFATPVFVAVQIGLRTILVSHQESWAWSTFVKLRLVGVLVGSLVVLAFVYFSESVSWQLGIAIMLLKVADSVADICFARIQYFNHLIVLGLISTFSATMTVVFATLAILFWNSMVIAVVSAALVSFVAAIFALAIGFRDRFDLNPHYASLSLLFKAALPITISQFLASMLFQIPVLLVGFAGNTGDVGIFAATAYLLTFANLVGSTLQTVLITPLRKMRERQGIFAALQKTMSTSGWIVAIGVPIVTVVVIFGSEVISFIYGSGFLIGKGPLLLIAASGILTVVAYVMSVLLNVLNRYTAVTFAIASSGVFALITGLGCYFWIVDDPIVVGATAAFAGAFSRVLFLFVFVGRNRIEAELNSS